MNISFVPDGSQGYELAPVTVVTQPEVPPADLLTQAMSELQSLSEFTINQRVQPTGQPTMVNTSRCFISYLCFPLLLPPIKPTTDRLLVDWFRFGNEHFCCVPIRVYVTKYNYRSLKTSQNKKNIRVQ